MIASLSGCDSKNSVNGDTTIQIGETIYYNTKEPVPFEPAESDIVYISHSDQKTDNDEITAHALLNKGDSDEMFVGLIDGEWYKFLPKQISKEESEDTADIVSDNNSAIDSQNFYNLTEQEILHTEGDIDNSNTYIQSQELWTNSTEITIQNNNDVNITVELFSTENETNPILEMNLNGKEKKSFTNLSSQYIYYTRISSVSNSHIEVSISD